MFKKSLKILNSNFLKLKLKKQNIIIESNVSFIKTTFIKNNRICANSHIDKSSIGKFSYIGWNSILRNVEIGSFCSIAPFVEVIYGSHPTKFISTHPIFYSNRKQCGLSFLKKNKYKEFNLISNTNRSVIIGNDVWIGYGAKIIEGVTIQNGAIVLAGSVVTKDVEAFSIVGGVPAKHIKYRFEENERKLLDEFQWWNKDELWIRENLDLFLETKDFFQEINKG
jgi:acetyltransferase-like isoleucine patch superfamily enzyme